MYHFNEKKIDLPEKILVRLQAMGKKFDLSQIILLFVQKVKAENDFARDDDIFLYWDRIKEKYDGEV